MTKAKISEYDAVAANNTDVNGVNIAEGCPPSGMNNMGREIMAALKRFQTGADGDSVTVGGSLVVSNTLTAGPVSATTLNTSGAVVFNDAGADVDFRVESDTKTHALFVDGATGVVGVNVEPETWGSSYQVVQIGEDSGVSNFGSGGYAFVSQNVLFGPSSNTYIKSAPATYYRQYNGTHGFFTAASGTAGNAASLTEQVRIDSSGNVGIGATSTVGYKMLLSDGTTNTAVHAGGGATYFGSVSSSPVLFISGNSERARIDTSGNLLVGTTSSTVAGGAGLAFQSSGRLVSRYTASSTFDRRDSDGDIVTFQKDGTTVGSIGSRASLYSYFEFGSIGTGIGGTNSHNWLPYVNGDRSDNTTDLGQSSYRFDDIYATNNVIQTSDRNEKQDIEELSEAETRVAVAAKALMRKYRWKSAVSEKGDDARIHFGIIAQDLKSAFEAEGLDAGRYAMFIHSAWWEKERVIPAVEGKEAVYETQTDEEGNETQVLVSEAVEAQPERTVIDTFETEEEGAVRKERMGIRYNELLAFIIAAI
jgi:hypothetical protein